MSVARGVSSLYSLLCSIVGSLAVRFCCFAVPFFVCDPACAVVLRMSSVTPRKRKRSMLSIQRKLEICDCVRNGWTYSQISAEYGIGKSTVFDIICMINMCLARLQTYGIFRVMDRGPVPTFSENWHSTVHMENVHHCKSMESSNELEILEFHWCWMPEELNKSKNLLVIVAALHSL